MASWLWTTGFALLVLETFAGMAANGFIVLLNCIDWFKSRTLSSTDLILTCLGMSRFVWQASVMLHITLLSFFLSTYTLLQSDLKFTILWLITDNMNLWFAAWLSTLYFIKIAIFSHPVFLQVKMRFSTSVPWLLLSSVVFSVFVSIAITQWSSDFALCHPYQLLLNNSCDSEIGRPPFCKYFVIAVSAPNFLPLAIFLSSTILLIISLGKHVRHLRNNGIRSRDLNTNIHLKAIKVLVSFAVLYLSSFVAISLQTMLVWINKDLSWTVVFFHNVSALYPSVHGIILISINPKLKQAWVGMIQLKMPTEGNTILKPTKRT